MIKQWVPVVELDGEKASLFQPKAVVALHGDQAAYQARLLGSAPLLEVAQDCENHIRALDAPRFTYILDLPIL